MKRAGTETCRSASAHPDGIGGGTDISRTMAASHWQGTSRPMRFDAEQGAYDDHSAALTIWLSADGTRGRRAVTGHRDRV